ncbi:MAG TPA: DNA primase [Tepidisphaeraceae bacterium]|nr:DNA primase [Tepidisphaeraceae bacterium]
MSQDSRALILAAVDIVELISQTVALKRRGRKYLGLCPFHTEKTPSFTVDPVKQAFYCFGCKASGSVFDFVMKRDRVEFKEALEILARVAGIELPQFGGGKAKTGERAAMVDALSAACRFFENLFNGAGGGGARAYLRERGFEEATLKKFQVGLAADAWDALMKGVVGKKFPVGVLVQAGLIKPRDKGEGHYDVFRNRIMFPIKNESGQIIAFGGRVVPGSTDPAKYLNSPETPLFNKGRSIFGLDMARQRIVETRTVAVVEGYTDVMMAHQFGASNVVSVLGTAMTEQHVGVLRRFADRIVLLFDADSAGDAAVDRVVQLFLTQPVEIGVATMPAGLDPDEFLLKEGAGGLERLIAGAADALEYAWKQLVRRFVSEAGDLTGQQKAAQQYLELLGSARRGGPVDQLRWGSALARVSRLTDIPVEVLHRRFGKVEKSGGKEAGRPISGQNVERGGSGRPSGGRYLAESQVLGVLLVEPKRWGKVQTVIGVEDFGDEKLKAVAEAYWNHQREEGEPVFNEFVDSLKEAELKALAIELADAVEEMDLEVTLSGALQYLAEARQRSAGEKIVATLRRTGEAQELSEEEQVKLLVKLQESARRPDLRRVGR